MNINNEFTNVAYSEQYCKHRREIVANSSNRRVQTQRNYSPRKKLQKNHN